MISSLKTMLTFLFISMALSDAFSQTSDFEQFTLSQKKTVTFPLDYKIVRPRLAYPDWDHDFDKFYHYLTPTLRKTQAALTFNDNGIVTTMTPNSIMPHAQLDTNMIINDNTKLSGTWRMLTYRFIRFNDSVYIPTKTYYRLTDTLLDDKSKDETFAVLTNNHFKLYVREAGKTDFKRVISSKYSIENRRYLMLYKFFKSGAGVSQFGIDEMGYLVLNYPKVIENIRKGEYFSYYTIIEQFIFEKVK